MAFSEKSRMMPSHSANPAQPLWKYKPSSQIWHVPGSQAPSNEAGTYSGRSCGFSFAPKSWVGERRPGSVTLGSLNGRGGCCRAERGIVSAGGHGDTHKDNPLLKHRSGKAKGAEFSFGPYGSHAVFSQAGHRPLGSSGRISSVQALRTSEGKEKEVANGAPVGSDPERIKPTLPVEPPRGFTSHAHPSLLLQDPGSVLCVSAC